jgi:trehalose-phosphatase
MVKTAAEDPNAGRELPPALSRLGEIARRLAGRRPVVFLDYDGTLTPIVARPELAILSDGMRSQVEALSHHCPVAIVSGRDRGDVEKLVRLPDLVYAGSHGFDIAGPGGMALEHEAGRACLSELNSAEEDLRLRLDTIPGAQVDRKRFGVAAHYRNVAPERVPDVKRAVADVLGRHRRLALREGKKVFDLRPDTDWDKGRAVEWLVQALKMDTPDVISIYLGDDLTDEDAFRRLAPRGIGIFVGEPPAITEAQYRLTDTMETGRFLGELTLLLSAPAR